MVREDPDPVFQELKGDIEAYPRLSGYYLLRLVELEEEVPEQDEASLDRLFQFLDDHPWSPVRGHNDSGTWAGCRASEQTASDEAVASLVGGRARGHLRDTISPKEALRFWARFRGLFSGDARCYVGLSLGQGAYTFQGGVVIVDARRAGALCVVEGD